MKASIALLALVTSMTVFANQETKVQTGMTSAAPFASSLWSATTSNGGLDKQTAAVIIQDIQEYDQSGKISPFLAQLIKGTLERHPDQNLADAVDSLASQAETALSK